MDLPLHQRAVTIATILEERVAELLLPPVLVGGEVPLEPADALVAFEHQQVGADAIQEEAMLAAFAASAPTSKPTE